MTRCDGTGPIVPAWIVEQVRLQEQTWPFRVLAAVWAGMAVVILVLLGVLWSSGPVVYYALP